jgi:hypothetical protein
LLKLSFEVSHSPGVANATGTVTTKVNEIKTNKAVNAVIINIFKVFLIDDIDKPNNRYYRLPFFNANKTITAGPANIITPVANNCPIICQLIIF